MKIIVVEEMDYARSIVMCLSQKRDDVTLLKEDLMQVGDEKYKFIIRVNGLIMLKTMFDFEWYKLKEFEEWIGEK